MCWLCVWGGALLHSGTHIQPRSSTTHTCSGSLALSPAMTCASASMANCCTGTLSGAAARLAPSALNSAPNTSLSPPPSSARDHAAQICCSGDSSPTTPLMAADALLNRPPSGLWLSCAKPHSAASRSCGASLPVSLPANALDSWPSVTPSALFGAQRVACGGQRQRQSASAALVATTAIPSPGLLLHDNS